MQIQSQLNGIRLAPRKVRAVANLLKGKSVPAALDQLNFLIKKPALPLKKLIDSGVANAEHNFSLVKDNLYIKNILVNEGIKLKRFRAKGFGRAAMIQKKTSRITLILDEKVPGLKQTVKAPEKEKTPIHTEPAVETKKQDKPEIKRKMGKKSLIRGLGNLKTLFRRKTIG